MKKIIGISLLILLLTGCGNKDLWDSVYTYDTIVCDYDNVKEIRIKQWADYEGEQVQIYDYDGNYYLLSMNRCYMKGHK